MAEDKREKVKDFLNQNPIYKTSILAEMVGYQAQNIRSWLKGERSIPNLIIDRIDKVLKKVAYK